ncbi:hypothetical protein PR202_gb06197 [Eleusine coracana subsp. coracana]|uniref:Secreted protein n=1 Tax=Eleusine coracana subsp. coracana TaxID=191504 RepID=A0AAV5E6H2_ELECO|nr:hypothetical protein PR202_gb06197 [Eleusine coracana subsp. coracana]
MGGSLSIPVAVFIAYTVVVSSVSCFCGWRARAAVVKLDMERAKKSQRRVARRAPGQFRLGRDGKWWACLAGKKTVRRGAGGD